MLQQTRLLAGKALLRQHQQVPHPCLVRFEVPVQAQLQQQQQVRCVSSKLGRKRKKKDDPFKVLGVTENSEYALAKKSFLRIAMANHPDTANVESEEEREKLRDIFIRARRAFESLVEGPDGSILRKEDVEHMDNFDEWFQQETGHENPFQFDMDPQLMREVAEMNDEVGGGLDRDGGMWHLAKMVSNTVKAGGDGAQMLRLEQGDTTNNRKDDQINGTLRRRRKRH